MAELWDEAEVQAEAGERGDDRDGREHPAMLARRQGVESRVDQVGGGRIGLGLHRPRARKSFDINS